MERTIVPKQVSLQDRINEVKIYYPRELKIQKLTSGNYLVKWNYREEIKSNKYQEFSVTECTNCLPIEKMPEFLSKHQEQWKNSDWMNWEKELKDNHLLIKKVTWDENGPH